MAKKILVIEDEDNLGRSIKTFLEQYNFKVTCISDGITGLESIRAMTPDLIITDLLLPRLHGFDICRTVKDDIHLKDIPLIIMTAVYKNAIHKLEARKLGVEDFIEKPVNFSDLLEKIEHYLGPAEHESPPTTVPEEELTDSPIQLNNEATVKSREDVIQEQFKVLRKDYASRLPQKISELEKVWAAVLGNNEPGKQLARLRRMVHSLTGSGATFGFKELSDEARKLELLLDMIIAEGDSTIEIRKDKINSLIDNMRHHPYVSTEIELMRQMGDKI
jgi:DNA-binding response OmpR family regulator